MPNFKIEITTTVDIHFDPSKIMLIRRQVCI